MIIFVGLLPNASSELAAKHSEIVASIDNLESSNNALASAVHELRGTAVGSFSVGSAHSVQQTQVENLQKEIEICEAAIEYLNGPHRQSAIAAFNDLNEKPEAIKSGLIRGFGKLGFITDENSSWCVPASWFNLNPAYRKAVAESDEANETIRQIGVTVNNLKTTIEEAETRLSRFRDRSLLLA